MEELLECSVCMNPFDNSNLRTPKMLPCQHSFCFECLERMQEAFLVTCPTCRNVHTILRIENVPNNFILLQLLDIQSRRSKDSGAATCQKCRQKSKKMCCQVCVDALVGSEVAQVVELMQGAEKGDSGRTKLRRRKPVVVPEAPPQNRHSQTPDSDLFSYMRTITILMVVFSIVLVVGFKSSPFFSAVRLQLHDFFTSIFYQSTAILKSITKATRKTLPGVISAMKNLFTIIFKNLMTCLSLIGRFVSDVAPFLLNALSQVTMFLLEVFASVLKFMLLACLALLTAAGNVLSSLVH